MIISSPSVTRLMSMRRAATALSKYRLGLTILLFYYLFRNYSLWIPPSNTIGKTAADDAATMPLAVGIASDHKIPPLSKKKNNILIETIKPPLDIEIDRKRNRSTTMTVAEITTSYDKKDELLLGCDEIAKLKVLRLIGTGKQKVTYEVKLPWGEHAALKRCKFKKCVEKGFLKKETELTRELHEQYGDQTVRYFGECNAAYTDINTYVLKTQLTNFSIGFTSVVELGKPLVSSWDIYDKKWDIFDTKCFADFYTETDIEDFRNIARLFANFSKSPTMLKINGTSDNMHPQQYMTRIGGSKEGRIKLLDLDTLETCKKGEILRNGENCTFNTALNLNCEIMAELTNIPDLNCSLHISNSTRTKPDAYFPNHGVNASHAIMECHKKNQLDRNRDWSTQRTIWLNKENKTLLECDEIAKLKVLHLIGTGKQKVTYEVMLPWGEHAVLKRWVF